MNKCEVCENNIIPYMGIEFFCRECGKLLCRNCVAWHVEHNVDKGIVEAKIYCDSCYEHYHLGI